MYFFQYEVPALNRPFIRENEDVARIGIHIGVGEHVAGRMHEVTGGKAATACAGVVVAYM
jgi:hypothetical protein